MSIDFTKANWRKSTHSNGEGACVEIASTAHAVGVRDSKQHGLGPILAVDHGTWLSFVSVVKRGSASPA